MGRKWGEIKEPKKSTKKYFRMGYDDLGSFSGSMVAQPQLLRRTRSSMVSIWLEVNFMLTLPAFPGLFPFLFPSRFLRSLILVQVESLLFTPCQFVHSIRSVERKHFFKCILCEFQLTAIFLCRNRLSLSTGEPHLKCQHP